MMNEGMIVLDHDLNIISYNREALEMLGTADSNELSILMQKVVSGNKELHKYIQTIKNEKNPDKQFTDKIKSPEGMEMIVQVNSLISAGQQNGDIFYLIMYPDKQKYWDEIHLNRSLKFNSIHKIAPSVAHEIRNPLSTLAIQRQILEETLSTLSLDSEKEQRVEKSLQMLNSEIDRVSRLMEHFFRLVRTGNSESTYEDVNSVLREIYELIRQYCYESGVVLKIQLQKSLPFVHLNRDKFIQVILNLIINSIESISDKGKLLIQSKKQGEKIVILIKDSGAGIPADQETKIFSYYFTTKENGGGVSLALSQKIVKEMGGEISFDSKHGQGVTFLIQLPRASKF
jgi:signal transduction histidine kinase